VHIGVLGPVDVVADSGEPVTIPGSKLRGLIAILALEAGRTVTHHRLIEAVWGDQGVSGPNVVQVIVSKLRRLLAESGERDCLSTHPAGYQMDVPRQNVDALRFEALVEEAHALDDPAAVAELLGSALDLWRGVPLSDVADTPLVDAIRSRLDESRKAAVDDLIDARLALGYHRRLVPELESLVAEDPLREHRWGQLLRALYCSGRQADAARVFQRARDVLIEQIGVEPGVELRQLEAAVLAQDVTLLGTARPEPSDTPVGEPLHRRGNVRYPVTACIGRVDEHQQLASLVERHRLITLTGPGGVGKTRLALELCVSLRDKVADGVWWVDLAAARSDTDVIAAILRSLRMDAGGASDPHVALDSVITALAERQAVLVLDNCEHLLAAVVPIVDALLGRCGDLRVLATSREGFDVPAERQFAVSPLSAAAAVELFEERIAGSPDQGIASAGTISEICDRLDRLPLALELAAARAKHLSLEEIRDRLSNRFELLPGGSRTAAAHQHNLRAVADWSYELLDEPERVVFERLAVFADGATLEGARRVCASPNVASSEIERLLHRLVDKSLVVADRSGAQTRFRMLQTLTDYAVEKLDTRNDRRDALRAHALWVRDLAGTVAFGTRTSGATVATVEDEDIAIRDAIAWSLREEPVLALEICSALSAFWFGTMRVSTGWELLSAALDASGPVDRALRSAALTWATVFSTMVQDTETAGRLADDALAVEVELDDPGRLGNLCFAIALAAGYRSDVDATPWIEQAREHFSTAGLPIGLGHVSFAEGAMHLVSGDIDAAACSLREASAAFRLHGDHLGLILAISRLGELAWRLGDIDLFAETHAELLELGRAGRSAAVVTGASARLALACLEQGDVDRAQTLATTALASSSESFMPIINGYAAKTAGLVNLRLGYTAEGHHQLYAAIEAFEQGAGGVGIGQAAMCWVDLSQSHFASGEIDAARWTAQRAVDAADTAGDPWIRAQAETNRAAVTAAAPSR